MRSPSRPLGYPRGGVSAKYSSKKLSAALRFWSIAFLLCSLWLANTANAAPLVSVGQSFTASTYNLNVVALPPDSNGAVGSEYFVEFINGSFAVYNKTNGQNVKRVTDLHFWSNAGVVISPDDVTTDPRIIYDPTVQRWFASMVDANGTAADPTLNANDFLFAVSAGIDPTGPWKGFLFQADPNNGYFADFPTLGLDSNAVYLAGDFFHGSNSPAGPGLISIPKADLLSATPTIANRTWSGVMTYDTRGEVLQPAICFDGSVTGQVVAASDIGNDSNPHSNLVCFAVLSSATPKALLSASTVIPTAPWVVPDNVDYGAPLLVVGQPDATTTLMANDARFSAKVYGVGGVLYAVHSTELSNHVAIRWYRIRAVDHVLLESGTIADPNKDLFFPSIAANPYGTVAIAYNGSGAGTAVSCYGILGQTLDGVTSFGSPVMLQNGAISYHGDDELLSQLLGSPGFSRWGDYSAISVDPSDPNRFWAIQMYPSDALNADVWSTQVSELVATPQVLLAIRPAVNGVLVSWPAVFANYQLQASPDPALAQSWTSVMAHGTTNGDQFVVSLPLSATRQFFRLQGQ